MNIRVHQVRVPPLQVFSYLLACSATREAAVVDPAGEADRLARLAEEESLKVRYLLLTHGHADHAMAAAELRHLFGAPLCLHEAEAGQAAEASVPSAAAPDMLLRHGDLLQLGRLQLRVIHTPGHTPGSVCYLAAGNLFTGDTLFVGAAGRTDLSGGSLEQLIESIGQRLIVLPPETIVWPGHDYGETPSSTMARELRENVYITDFLP